jgi:hypothetical protein
MEWPENIDSWISDSQLGASSWRHHRTLYHLQIQYLTLGERRGNPVFSQALAERAN